MVIVLITAFTGITDEHRLGSAFKDAMPFTALLVVLALRFPQIKSFFKKMGKAS